MRRLVSVKQVWHLLRCLFTTVPMAWHMLPRPPRSRLTLRQRMSRYFWISQITQQKTWKRMTEFNATQLKITYPCNRQITIFSSSCMMQTTKQREQFLYTQEMGFSRGCSSLSEMEFPKHNVFTSLPPVIWTYLSRNMCLDQISHSKNTQTGTPPQLLLGMFSLTQKAST